MNNSDRELRRLADPAPEEVAGFSCQDVPDLQEFIRQDAMDDYVKQHLAVIYLGWCGADLVGYFALSCGILRIQEFSKGERAKAELDRTVESIPGVLLGRLAVDERFRKRGFGGWLFREAVGIARNAIAPLAGCRFLFVDARSEAIDWYERKACSVLGPAKMPPATTRMGLDLFPPPDPSN